MSDYQVDGMGCGSCADSVTKAIQAIAPQAIVTVDVAAKRVGVQGFDDREAIAQAVQGAGFEFVGPFTAS